MDQSQVNLRALYLVHLAKRAPSVANPIWCSYQSTGLNWWWLYWVDRARTSPLVLIPAVVREIAVTIVKGIVHFTIALHSDDFSSSATVFAPATPGFTTVHK